MSSTAEAILIDETFLLDAIRPFQARLRQHPLYGSIQSLAALRVFMESHVYAVWDFMSLLKALQRVLTCVEVPWKPTPNPMTRRLINEIVLGEESDTYQGAALSHFELYLRAMADCGADPSAIERQTISLADGISLRQAFTNAPAESRRFVESTFAVLDTGAPHRIAAAFGREDLIPDMFTAFVRELDAQLPGQVAAFRYYLERHIEVDGEEHGPMALAMLRELCPSAEHWAEATASATAALEARIALWNGIHARVLAAAAANGREAEDDAGSSNRLSE